MRNLILFIAFSFSYLFGIDCNSMSSISTFNGHYYAKTNTRAAYDTIRVSAINDKAYLAIPNSAEENNFIKSLVGGNTEAWIGVFDPNHAKNYCYDNGTCFFDDARFRDVKGQVITYRNWASYEPNNFVEASDIENNLATVDPLGENWVIMNGNTGQWYDVGNHKSSNQNPRNHVAIVEFDEKPICLNESDGVTETDFSERVCNTQVFDDNIANADKGTTAKCLFDINGKEYCPQALADAKSYWSYINGDSYKNITSVTDYAQGEYKKFTSIVRDFMDGFASTHTSTVTDLQTGSGIANVGTVIDYQNGSSIKKSGTVVDYTSKVGTSNQFVVSSISMDFGEGTEGIDYADGWGASILISNSRLILETSFGYGSAYGGSGFVLARNDRDIKNASAFATVNQMITGDMSINYAWQIAINYDYARSILGIRGGQNGDMYVDFKNQTISNPNAFWNYTFYFENGHLKIREARGLCNVAYGNGLKMGKICSTINNMYFQTDIPFTASGGTSFACPSDYTDNGINCQKIVYYDMYAYTCPADYKAVNNGFNSFTKTDPNTASVNWNTLDDDVNSSIPPKGNCYKNITYSYYNYNCPIGYTVNDGGLTASCPKIDPNNTTNDALILSQSCNNSTPPVGNCTKIIPYTFYSYECSNGYTALDKGLSTCTKKDTSNSIDTSNSLGQSCNNSTPPAANCYKDISYDYYTYSCPAGYEISNHGLTSCPKKDPNNAINNENELNDSCNDAAPPAGNCSKSIEYSYYQYVCTGATNEFGETYAPVSTGLTSCTKTDTDLINTNTELANSCNDAISPDNNCKTTSYTCNSQVREPVWIDNKWQCSPYPCYGNSNVEDLSKNVGSLDKDDNGWTEQGKCSGTIYIFNGAAKQCRASDKFFGLTGGGCCKDDKTAMGLLSCKAEEKELRLKKESKKCHYVGEYCSKKINIGFAKICVRTSKSYCCFNSTLGRIIAEQGREQLTDIDWGVASNPNCRGFTIEEFQRLDLSQMDLTEFTNSIQLPDVTNKKTEIIDKINSHLNLIK